MNTRTLASVQFEDDNDEIDVAEQLPKGTVSAVVTGTDWTTETIVSQLQRGNIALRPKFQRRDAWKRDRKSRFIESLILGLPIPQIVLAESKTERGRFIVLDGKQRLLSIMQFWGLMEGDNNSYRLSGLTLRPDLGKVTYKDLATKPEHESDYNALCNQSIRTIVIKNWLDTDFLHTVFLRLNTGNVPLSPQELRQALLPGVFSDYIDDVAANLSSLHRLLGGNSADPRMRDIEILARFLAFRFFSKSYPGRMKRFLDSSFESFNDNWELYEPQVSAAVKEFDEGVSALLDIFGDELARKPGSVQFNRAIFDALIHVQANPSIRHALKSKKAALRRAYEKLFDSDSEFQKAIESDTAGLPNTVSRFRVWSSSVSSVLGKRVSPPAFPDADLSKKKKKQ